MSLNPSNSIAARANPGRTMFPNLARRKPESLASDKEAGDWGIVCAHVDHAIRKELKAAGIKSSGPHVWLRDRGEVPSGYIGEHCRWGFERAWYYWIAKGPGIPADKAEEFHKEWGTQVRVEGHCGCPSPLEYNHGFAVGRYHIDTQEGLCAFAKLLESIYIPGKDDKDGQET